MNAAVQPKYDFVVSEAEARENVRREKEHKAQARANKEAQRKYAEALRQDRLRDKQRAEEEAARATTPAVVAEAPAPVSRVGVITHRVSDAELERNLRPIRRQAAERAYHHLVEFLKLNDYMSHEEVAREFEGALFMPVDGEEGTYACEGVKIHLDELSRISRFEANVAKHRLLRFFTESTSYTDKLEALAIEGFTPGAEDGRGNPTFERDGISITLFGSRANSVSGGKRVDSRLNDQQRIAAERRGKHCGRNAVEVAARPAVRPTQVVRTAEEVAKTRAENIARAAELKAAKDRKQAAFKAAHPKARKAQSTQPKKSDDKKKKGGK